MSHIHCAQPACIELNLMSCTPQYNLSDVMRAHCGQSNVPHMVAPTVEEQNTATVGFELPSLQ